MLTLILNEATRGNIVVNTWIGEQAVDCAGKIMVTQFAYFKPNYSLLLIM